MTRETFAQRIIAWHAQHGRHDLPWQHPRRPYRVWLSEIMLQQTTVAAVVPYFQRFEARFPNLRALADAELDEVLSLWQGLGYYARARNLHACAQRIRDDYAGEFPRQRDELEALPGIGRSTAAAICAQAWGQREAILDGNVKRVLARHAGIPGWPGKPAVQKRLWQESEQRLPPDNIVAYTQGLMDLGAGLCARKNPICAACPVAADCRAKQTEQQNEIPAAKPKKARLQRHCLMLVSLRQGKIQLVRRPNLGIWGGLWSLPEFSSLAELPDQLGYQELPLIQHAFSHFDLDIQPLLLDPAPAAALVVADAENTAWVAWDQLQNYGLPTPVRRILASLPT